MVGPSERAGFVWRLAQAYMLLASISSDAKINYFISMVGPTSRGVFTSNWDGTNETQPLDSVMCS